MGSQYLRGNLEVLKPHLSAKCVSGKLILGKGHENIKIDTAFDYCISAPISILNQLNLVQQDDRLVDVGDFEGKTRKKKVYIGQVKIRKKVIDTYFIEGNFLLGMEFAYDVFKTFKLDFVNEKFSLKLR
ncbi:MAG: hypothetical protein JSS63_15210 [Bacteroidetes bacterium]|nr:hypothetical protein [Bacteroidota bacterium]